MPLNARFHICNCFGSARSCCCLLLLSMLLPKMRPEAPSRSPGQGQPALPRTMMRNMASDQCCGAGSWPPPVAAGGAQVQAAAGTGAVAPSWVGARLRLCIVYQHPDVLHCCRGPARGFRKAKMQRRMCRFSASGCMAVSGHRWSCGSACRTRQQRAACQRGAAPPAPSTPALHPTDCQVLGRHLLQSPGVPNGAA